MKDSQPRCFERITPGIFAITFPCRSIRQTDPSSRFCTQMEPNAEISAPGFGTSTVRFGDGSGEGEGPLEGLTDDGDTVTLGSEVVVDVAAVQAESARTRHVSVTRRIIGPR